MQTTTDMTTVVDRAYGIDDAAAAYARISWGLEQQGFAVQYTEPPLVDVPNVDFRGRLHAERFELPESTAEAIDRTRARGGRVIAVGTTTTRVLETRAQAGGRVAPGSGETELFLAPGSAFEVVDGLVTNFHLPRSSLLLLVAAFVGREPLLAAYREAIAREYRFYSYGDAMAIL